MLLEQTLENKPSPGEGKRTDTRCGRRKAIIPTIIIAAMILTAAAWIAINRGLKLSDIKIGGYGHVDVSVEGADAPDKSLDPGDAVNITPMVKNNGNVEIYAFLTMDVPLGQTEDSSIELYTFDPSNDWTQVGDVLEVTVEETNFRRYIYAYVSGGSDGGLIPLEGHDATTEPLFGGSAGGYVMVNDLGDVESISYSSIRFNAYGIACNRFENLPSVDEAWTEIADSEVYQ